MRRTTVRRGKSAGFERPARCCLGGAELTADPLYAAVRATPDGTETLRRFAAEADAEPTRTPNRPVRAGATDVFSAEYGC